MKNLIPYPLRAARLSISIMPFGFWMLSFVHQRNLTEQAKRDGETIWWIRFAWFQISYSRWL
jgi:hypothetical protein